MIAKQIRKTFDIPDTQSLDRSFPEMPAIDQEFGILLIVGSSGSGKSSILNHYFNSLTKHNQWEPNKPICEYFNTEEEAITKLSAVGLNSVPAWLKPFDQLSTGEQFRANLARSLESNTAIDEFTSVVDRSVAKSASVALSKYVKQNNVKNLVIASCHRDIIEWLSPDLIFDTDTKQLYRGVARRPDIELELYECPREYKKTFWEMFKKHHYLNTKLNMSAHCYLLFHNQALVGFSSAIAYPSGSVKNAFRGHRTVIFPDFQGMGLGSALSDMTAQLYIEKGCRYFSRTSHPRLGQYRENSVLWKPTSKNRVIRKDIARITRKKVIYNGWIGDAVRNCYSHEYIGKRNEKT